MSTYNSVSWRSENVPNQSYIVKSTVSIMTLEKLTVQILGTKTWLSHNKNNTKTIKFEDKSSSSFVPISYKIKKVVATNRLWKKWSSNKIK